MKILMAFSLVILSALSAESAQRVDKNTNLAVMLAYRPNSEIRMRDKNQSWVYKIGAESESHENINAELLEELIKERYAQRVGEERKTVKRENVCENCGGSTEESEEIDDAKVVQIDSQNATCKQNVYNKVLSELQKALKSEIKNYKKCVCQKKTTPVPTTEAPEDEDAQGGSKLGSREINLDNEDDGDLGAAVNNEQELEDALKNKGKDVICFPRQYAFMLNKLLKRVPCNKTDDVNPRHEQKPMKVDITPEYQQEDVEESPRAERNNKKYVEDSESYEIDVSDFKPSSKPITARPKTTTLRPKTTTQKPRVTKPTRKSFESKTQVEDQPEPEKDNLSERILAIIKEHEAKQQKPVSSKKKRHQSPPKKIVVKPKEIPVEEEKSTEDFEEFSEQQFAAKLQELFKKYQIKSDETFPVQSGENSAQSTSPVPSRKLVKKSANKNSVAETSDESAEGSFKLKARPAEKERHPSREGTRKTGSGSSRIASTAKHVKTDTGSGGKRAGSPKPDTKKSYRTSARSEDASNRSEAETAHVPRSHHHDKASHRVRKNARAHVDHQAAADFAKKISDFARGKSS